MVLINGKIKPMSSPDIENGYIIIENGKIAKVDKMENYSTNPDLEVIDLKGKLVIPGYIDAHTHLGMSEDGVGDEGEDINEMSEPCTPQIRSLDAIDPMDATMEDAWRAGVTTIIASPGSANPIAGQITALKTYGRRVDDMVIKEPFAMKFSLGENPKGVYGENEEQPMSRMATAAIIRENLAKTVRYIEEKESAKENDDRPPELDFKLEALEPVLKGEIAAHFHAHRAYDLITAIRIAKEFSLEYTLIHCTEGHRIADILAEENAKVVIGPIFGTRSKPELSRQTIKNCSVLVDAGLDIAISSDHPEVQIELLPISAALVANNGISEEDALKSLTYNAAKAVGLEKRIGSIAAGLDADLLVFDINPLDVKAKPCMVYIDGNKVV